MSMKFGLRIDVDLRKRVTSSNTKPDVVLRRRLFILKINKRSYRRRGCSDLDEIWFSGRTWSSKDNDVNKYKAGSSMEPLRPHLEIVYDVITQLRVTRFGRNLVFWCRKACRLLWYGRNRNRVTSIWRTFVFFKPEVVISQPWIMIRRRNLVCG